jgi:hypothetical protein
MPGLPLSAGVGTAFKLFIQHPKQITTTVAAGTYKVYPGIVGRVIKLMAVPGIHAGTTVMTDLDLTVKKGTTALHGTAIAAVDSSTAASTEAVLSPTLVSTAATLALGVDDYLDVTYTVTGGNSPTCDGAGVIVYIARE